jgi:hypothetical protein
MIDLDREEPRKWLSKTQKEMMRILEKIRARHRVLIWTCPK